VRIASEGLVGLVVDGNKGAVIEVNAETDFVSRNEKFQAFVRTAAGIALAKGGDLEAVKAAAYPGTGRNVADELTNLVATIGENMSLRRCAALSVGQGALGAYLHNVVAEGLGKIAVLVALKGADAAKIAPVAKQVAMHVAAANPQSVSRADLDPAALERERNVLMEQSRASGKPEAIIEKMVEGRLRKFYEEACLVDQVFVIDGESKVGMVAEGAGATVEGFVRYALGEGLAKRDEDFAAEVAATAGR
jgi:elongation factor Ts